MSATASPSHRGWAGIRRAFGTPAAATMVFLGFGSGLPFLLLTSVTLMTWLRDAGVALGTIGLISYAGFFYVLKPLWAPLVDRYNLPGFARLGRRRGWLFATQLLLTGALAAMAWRGLDGGIAPFVALIALAAIAGATQDIVVDAYRVEIAPPEAQAALAASYSLGYRIALYASGAGALYLAEFQTWHIAYAVMAALMLFPLGATLLCREPDDGRTAAMRSFNIGQAFVEPFREFFSRNGLVFALVVLGFVGLFKFPDQVIGVMAGPFYLDSGYTKADIATVSKLYGVWIGLGGAFLGGLGVAAFGLRRMLAVALVAVALSNLAYLLMAQHPSMLWAFFAAISADNLSQGFAGTVLIAFMSGLTHRDFTATQFALLVSLANLPGKFVGGLSGFLVEASSYSAFFVMSALIVLPAALLLAWLWPRIDRQSASSA